MTLSRAEPSHLPTILGQVASQTSNNNPINFCISQKTNHKRPTVRLVQPNAMGVIASTGNVPSSKFVFSPNLGTVKVNTVA